MLAAAVAAGLGLFAWAATRQPEAPDTLVERAKAARAAAVGPPGGIKATKAGRGGHVYGGAADVVHLGWLKGWIEKRASEATDAQTARLRRAFAALQTQEGTTAAINTWDNMILTWGTGFGGLGALPRVLERLRGTEAERRLAQAGFTLSRPASGGQPQYAVVDTKKRRVVVGRSDALEVVRADVGLLRVLANVARDPATRGDVAEAMMSAFTTMQAATVGDLSPLATLPAVTFVAHLGHWAPAYAKGALAWAASQEGGELGAERDARLLPRVVEKFYANATAKPGLWVPSFAQLKTYWDRARAEGLKLPQISQPASVAGWLPEIVSPGDILDYLRRVDAEMAAVHATRAVMPAALQEGWDRFYGTWRTFFGEHQGWTDRLTGTIYDEAEVYEKQLARWREELKGAGVKPVGPPPAGASDRQDEGGSGTALVLGGLAAGLALAVVAAKA